MVEVVEFEAALNLYHLFGNLVPVKKQPHTGIILHFCNDIY